jgi:DNA modification methylase
VRQLDSTPYFQGDGITLYCADNQDCLAWLAGDVLITDPPYGMKYAGGSSQASWMERNRPIEGDKDTTSRDMVLDGWGERPALVFGTWKCPRPAGRIRQLLVWDKGDTPGMGDTAMPWGPAHEEIYVFGEGWTGKRQSNVLRHNTLSGHSWDRPDHPTPKPVPLMEELVRYAPPGVIVDPFAGSGSTLRACMNLGREAIGIELEERFCEVIVKQLAQMVLFADA